MSTKIDVKNFPSLCRTPKEHRLATSERFAIRKESDIYEKKFAASSATEKSMKIDEPMLRAQRNGCKISRFDVFKAIPSRIARENASIERNGN